MKYRVKRLATCVDKYGLLQGALLYTRLKLNKVNPLNVPGIIHPMYLRKATSDLAIFDQVFLRGDYDISFPFTPRTIIDAGANIGLFSVLMKNRFPGSTVIAIEPDQRNFELLEKNTSPYKGIEPVHAGLWHTSAKLEVVDTFRQGFSALAVRENAKQGTIRGITIHDVMREYALTGIDVLKIDIEASEQYLFSHNTGEWLRKVRMIVIELHDDFAPGCSRIFFDALNRTLLTYRYTVCGENTIIENLDFQNG